MEEEEPDPFPTLLAERAWNLQYILYSPALLLLACKLLHVLLVSLSETPGRPLWKEGAGLYRYVGFLMFLTSHL